MSTAATLPRPARYSLILILIVAAGALAFRLPLLTLKPFHGDEANQAYKAGTLLDTGVYHYDPIEHHGPTIYFMMLPFAWLTTDGHFADTTEATYRIVPVLFGAACVLLLIPLRNALGTRAVVLAAILTAVSPAMVFYSRYFIQEMLLVFFEFGAIVAVWRYFNRHSYGALIAGGLCVGLAHASKETCILAFASYGGAAVCTIVWGRLRDDDFAVVKSLRSMQSKHVAAGFVVAVFVSVLFFSSFFTYGRGVLDSVLTYVNYSHKAGNFRIHDKPWPYYLQMLFFTKHAPYPWFSEALILVLAAVGMLGSLALKRSAQWPALNLLRFMTFYAAGLTVAYSAIPYKTPWCALNFLQPLIVLAGVGADFCIRMGRGRAMKGVVAVIIAALTAQLGAQAYRASYVYYADPRNPYVYAHTSGAFAQLAQRLDDLGKVSADGYNFTVAVVSTTGDYWPLPFYLRKFKNTGYWTDLPGDVNSPFYSAPVFIASPNVAGTLRERLRGEYHTETGSLRPGVLLAIFIRQDLWDSFMATRTAPSTAQ